MALTKSKQCVHRWVLSEATMRDVQATCRRCGAHRTYPSAIELDYRQAVPNYVELDADLSVVQLPLLLVEEETHV
jgi:hypothetical protein